MKPGELYWSVVEPLWDKISIYDGPENFLNQYSRAPVGPRTLFAAHWCQSEVRNGGLHQFFINSTGVLAPEAVHAFREIDMPRLAAVVEEAMRFFGPDFPRDRDIRIDALDAFGNADSDEWNPFDQLDHEFFGLVESENGGFAAAADTFAGRIHGQ